MATCILHAGKFAEGSSCPKCKSCKHESVWKLIDDSHTEESEQWRCNGCTKRFDKVPVGNKGRENKTFLYFGAWVNADDLIVCESCGKHFIATRNDTKCCSDVCRKAKSRKK